MNSIHTRGGLRRSTVLVTIGGSLAMVYYGCIANPAATEFFRTIGANPIHFGILGGVPMLMLFVHFVGAFITNGLRSRRVAFVVSHIASRLLFLPVAFMPLVFPSMRTEPMLAGIILMIAVSGALSNIGHILFMSWMSDLIPHRILNRYWATRQRAMCLASMITYVGVALFTWCPAEATVLKYPFLGFLVDMDIMTRYPILASVGVAAGVIDILLFFRVREPCHATVRDRPALGVFLEPLFHPQYRTYLLFQCVWTAGVAILGAFTQIYLLSVLNVSVPNASMLLCLHISGTALATRLWGGITDKHGHKPVLRVVLVMKPLYALALLLASEHTALWLLPLVFLFDGSLNAGLGLALTGYSIKMAPRENRSMFLAAATGLSGIFGGIAAILAGMLLKAIGDFRLVFAGREWINYEFIFALSFLMRIGCVFLANVIREPTKSGPSHVLLDLLPAWCARRLVPPVGANAGERPQQSEPG